MASFYVICILPGYWGRAWQGRRAAKCREFKYGDLLDHNGSGTAGVIGNYVYKAPCRQEARRASPTSSPMFWGAVRQAHLCHTMTSTAAIPLCSF
jgi:hypothetical protein